MVATRPPKTQGGNLPRKASAYSLESFVDHRSTGSKFRGTPVWGQGSVSCPSNSALPPTTRNPRVCCAYLFRSSPRSGGPPRTGQKLSGKATPSRTRPAPGGKPDVLDTSGRWGDPAQSAPLAEQESERREIDESPRKDPRAYGKSDLALGTTGTWAQVRSTTTVTALRPRPPRRSPQAQDPLMAYFETLSLRPFPALKVG
jgi:hypothetical protein